MAPLGEELGEKGVLVRNGQCKPVTPRPRPNTGAVEGSDSLGLS